MDENVTDFTSMDENVTDFTSMDQNVTDFTSMVEKVTILHLTWNVYTNDWHIFYC